MGCGDSAIEGWVETPRTAPIEKRGGLWDEPRMSGVIAKRPAPWAACVRSDRSIARTVVRFYGPEPRWINEYRNETGFG